MSAPHRKGPPAVEEGHPAHRPRRHKHRHTHANRRDEVRNDPGENDNDERDKGKHRRTRENLGAIADDRGDRDVAKRSRRDGRPTFTEARRGLTTGGRARTEGRRIHGEAGADPDRKNRAHRDGKTTGAHRERGHPERDERAQRCEVTPRVRVDGSARKIEAGRGGNPRIRGRGRGESIWMDRAERDDPDSGSTEGKEGDEGDSRRSLGESSLSLSVVAPTITVSPSETVDNGPTPESSELSGMTYTRVHRHRHRDQGQRRTRGTGNATRGDGIPPTVYLFGYGSLIDEKSRESTWPSATEAFPVVVTGVERGWFDRLRGEGPATTFLGAVRSKGALCNGVLFAVTEEELASYDDRETGYVRERIDPRDVRTLDGTRRLPRGSIVWFYATAEPHRASSDCPIVQSYVDLCMVGCLEVERRYPLAAREEFTRQFVRTCSGWSRHWINDRVYPRRPFAVLPEAGAIDRVLSGELGEVWKCACKRFE